MNVVSRFLFRRPSLLNAFHWLRLIDPTSQTISSELQTLSKYARGRERALEIGSYQGVSAAFIAGALRAEGRVYCVDPWLDTPRGSRNPCYLIFERHLHRLGLWDKIAVLRGYSSEIVDQIPNDLDFIFVDGDHSWAGLAADWQIVKSRLGTGGVVCLHDTLIPTSEPWRTLESVRFFDEVITKDPDFRVVEQVHSMTVLARSAPAN